MGALLDKANSLGIKPYGQMDKTEKVQYHQAIAKKFKLEAEKAENDATLSSVLTRGAKKVTGALGLDKAADTIGSLHARKGATEAERAFIPKPTRGEVAGAALQVGSLLAPVGTAARLAGGVVGKAAGNIIAGAGTGYAMDVGSKLSRGDSGAQAFKPGIGTAVGAAVPGAFALGSGVKNVTKKAATKLSDAVTQIDSVTEKTLNPASSIPKEVIGTIPQETLKSLQSGKSEKLEYYLNKARRAVENPSAPTPLEYAGKKAEETLTKFQEKMKKQGTLKSAEVQKFKDAVVPNVQKVRENMLERIAEVAGGKFQNGKFTAAEGRAIGISDPADIKLLKTVSDKIKALGDTPTFRTVDDTVDFVQDLLYKRKANLAVPVNSKVAAILKQSVGQLNKELKRIGGKTYTRANDKYAAFIEVRDRLNKALGQDGNKGGALMKRVFSPSDGGTKKLFRLVKKITGIDLNEEAVLAKFAMEQSGDARQASLLEQLELVRGAVGGGGSFVGKAVDKILSSSQDPVGKARRIVGGVKETVSKPNTMKSPGDFLLESMKGKGGLSLQDVSKDVTKQVQYRTKKGWMTMSQIADEYMNRTAATKSQALEWARDKVKGMAGKIKKQ